MDSLPQYSFIMPAYNAEKTIKRAIDSITSRMKNCEVIVIENGSIDETTTIVERLSSCNENIKLLHCDKGVSKARNVGIEYAKGEWLIFVDADDEWMSEERDINKLTNKHRPTDILVCSYYKEGTPVAYDYKDIDTMIEEDRVINAASWLMKKPTQRMTAWAKLYKRDFIEDNDLLFNEKLRISEDSEFIIRCLIKCNRIVISNLPAYKYCTDTVSTIRSIDETRTEEYLNSLRVVREETKENSSITDKAYLDYAIAQLNLICVHDIFNCDIKVPWKTRIDMAKDLLCEGLLRDIVNLIGISQIVDINCLPAFFFKHGMISVAGSICYGKSVSNKRKATNN